MNLKRRAFLAVLLVLLFVILLNLRKDSPQAASPVNYLDRVIVSVFAPFQRVIERIDSFFHKSWSGYIALIGVEKENEKLKESLAIRDLTILSLKERLKAGQHEEYLQQKIGLLGWEGVSARVIGYDPFARSQTMWLSVGSDQGVRIDQPVMTHEGLVGRVIKVFPDVSQVLLLVDASFAVDVIDETTRVRALVVGSGSHIRLKRYPFLTHLEFLNLGDEIHKGDLLLTSGLSPLYPPGIPVGNVIEVKSGGDELFQSSVVLPMVDISKLEQVIVLTGKTTGKTIDHRP